MHSELNEAREFANGTMTLMVTDLGYDYQLSIMNDATGPLDGSISYQVNDNRRIVSQCVELTQEIIHTRAVINDDLLNALRRSLINDQPRQPDRARELLDKASALS